MSENPFLSGALNLHTTFLHTQEEENRQQSKCSLSLRIDKGKYMTPDFHQGMLFSTLLVHSY